MRKYRTSSMVVAMFLLGVAVSFSYGQYLASQERRELARELRLRNDIFRKQLDTLIDSYARTIKRLSGRWSLYGMPSESVWRQDMIWMMRDYPAFLEIQWVNDQMESEWRVSHLADQSFSSRSVCGDSNICQSFYQNADHEQISAFSPIRLDNGKTGFMVAAPIHIQGRFVGFIAAFFSSEQLIKSVYAGEFGLAMSEGVDQHYLHAGDERSRRDELTTHLNPLPGLNWVFSSWPTRAMYEARFTRAPQVAFGVGIFISLLLSSLLAFIDLLRRQGRTLKTLGADLQEEVRNQTLTLRDRERRLRLAIEAINAGEWILDLVTERVQNSLQHDRIFGYDELQKDWTYQRFLEHVHPDDRARVAERLRDTVAKRQNWNIECRIVRVDGQTRWVRAVGHYEQDEQGRLSQLIGLIEDITERKLAEEELVLSRKKLEAALASMSDAVFIADREGHFIDFNEAFATFHKFDSKEQCARALKDYHKFLEVFLANGEKAPVGEWSMSRALRGEIGTNVEYTLRRSDTGETWVGSYSYAPIRDDKARIMGAVVTSRDVTEQKRVALELRAAKEAAENANRAKSQFLANMSHELRTPMNGIMGMTDLVLMTPLDERQKRNLSLVKTSAKHLLGIINDILDLAKIEAGHLQLNLLSFNPWDLVRENMALVSMALTGRKLDLRSHIDPEIPARLLGDPLRLTQILQNLLNNAVKFTQNGQIELDVSLEKQDREGYLLKFVVSDTGIGIPSEAMGRLFQYFSQIEHGQMKKYGGAGLGLAISKQLTEKMGGTIWADSKVGEGSRFSFTAHFALDEALAQVGVQGAVLDQEGKLPKIRVLAVEDDFVNAEVISLFCELHSLRCSLARTGAEALSFLRESDFDLILLDIQLPDIGGVELARMIRADLGLLTPIIATTAFALSGQREFFLASGMNDYIAKPMDLHELETKMLRLVPQKKLLLLPAPGEQVQNSAR